MNSKNESIPHSINMKKIILLLLVIILVHANFVTAQELPRAASFGAAVADVNDSLAKALKLPNNSGSLLKKKFCPSPPPQMQASQPMMC